MYRITERGRDCEDERLLDLSDEPSCRDAVSHLTHMVPNIYFSNVVNLSDRTKRCMGTYLDTPQILPGVFWNTHPTGNACATCQAICKIGETLTGSRYTAVHI